MVVNIDTGVTEEWLRFVQTLDERYGGDAIKMIVRPEQVAAGGVIRQGADDVTPVLIQPGKSQWKTLTSGDSVYGEQSSGQVTGHEAHTG